MIQKIGQLPFFSSCIKAKRVPNIVSRSGLASGSISERHNCRECTKDHLSLGLCQSRSVGTATVELLNYLVNSADKVVANEAGSCDLFLSASCPLQCHVIVVDIGYLFPQTVHCVVSSGLCALCCTECKNLSIKGDGPVNVYKVIALQSCHG